jgi:phosphoenolpyruvate synthase/pyruvate phosphate dikinase
VASGTSPVVVDREGVGSTSPGEVGTKAATLARLAAAGLPVPEFFVVTAEAFARHLRDNGIAWADPGEAGDVDLLRDRIRRAPVPDAIASTVLGAYRDLCAATGHDHVAVRSSGGEEDAPSASFAGQFASVLGVAGDRALLDALVECWASCISGRSLRYRASLGTALAKLPAFGVIVQAQVFSEKAGVLFTVHPLDAGTGSSYLEANFGTGESVTGGLATPDAVEISRLDPDLVQTRIGTKRRMTTVSPDAGGSNVVETDPALTGTQVLTRAEASGIARAGLRVEALLGSPQDVEWAIDARGLWILQSRPITTTTEA